MIPSPVTNLMPFVPARDYELSKRFYTDLGFKINFTNPQISELQAGSFRFLLQPFYVADHAGNFVVNQLLRHDRALLRIGLVVLRIELELDLLAIDHDALGVSVVDR